MLNQRWMFKNTKTYGKSIYRDRVGRLINEYELCTQQIMMSYIVVCNMDTFILELNEIKRINNITKQDKTVYCF